MWSEHKIKALFTLFHAIAVDATIVKIRTISFTLEEHFEKKLRSRKLVETKFKL